MWDSGFLTKVYTWKAFCGGKTSPNIPLLLFNRGSLWIFLASMDSANTCIFKHITDVWDLDEGFVKIELCKSSVLRVLFSVLIEIYRGFSVLGNFLSGFSVFYGPQRPHLRGVLKLHKIWNFVQARFGHHRRKVFQLFPHRQLWQNYYFLVSEFLLWWSAM